jgi:hypothetical protein
MRLMMNEIKLIVDGNIGDLLIVCRNMREVKMMEKMVGSQLGNVEGSLMLHKDVSFHFCGRSWNGWCHKSWYLTVWSHKKFEVLNLTEFLHPTFVEIDDE